MLIKGYDIPWWVVAIVILIVIGIIWFYIIPWIKGKFASASSNSKILGTGQNPTITDQQAKDIADGIFNDAHTLWTNDTTDIDAQFGKLGNDADYYTVEKEFGVRTWGIWPDTSTGDLSQFITAFLDNDQVAQVNKILSDKGITFQF